MRLLIWGQGQLAAPSGAYLIQAGHDITFVDRAADHVAAINQKGLTITGPIAEFTVPATAFTPTTLRPMGNRAALRQSTGHKPPRPWTSHPVSARTVLSSRFRMG